MTELAPDFMGKKVHEAAAVHVRTVARAATWRAERLAATTKLFQQQAAYADRLSAEPDADAAARAGWKGELGLAALEQEIRDLDSLLQRQPAAEARARATWQQAQAAEALAFYERVDPTVRALIEEVLEKTPIARWGPLLEKLRPIAALAVQWAHAVKGLPGYRRPAIADSIPLPERLASPDEFWQFLRGSLTYAARIGIRPLATGHAREQL